MKRLSAVLVALGLLSVANTAQTQDSYGLHEKGLERINLARNVAPLGADSFGDRLSLFNGTVEFSNVDVSVPGNNTLPVQVGRRFAIEDRGQSQPLGLGYLGGFGEWDVDVPYLKGTFDANRGWTVENASGSSDTTARCTNTNPPPSTMAFPARSYWHGYFFHLPGQGDSALLAANPQIPTPANGSHPWTTKDFWRFKCKAATKNNYPGEAFIAVSPDGTAYHLDWVVSRNAPSIRAGYTYNQLVSSLTRKNVYFLASRIEDRFGNWVDLGYTGDKLTSVTSSDGRWISLTYAGQNVTSVASSVGTWTYAYTSGGRLSSVTRPDQSTWTYTASGNLQAQRQDPLAYSDTVADCPQLTWGDSGGAFTYHVKHPSGASAQYDFQMRRHYRRNIPKYCEKPRNDYEYLLISPFSTTYSLDRKVITGPGLSAATWTYTYEAGSGFVAFREGPCATNPQGPLCIKTTKVQTVQGPVSTETYEFGTHYEVNEGQLVKHEILDASGAALRSTASVYMTNSEASSQVFQAWMGATRLSLGDEFSAAAIRPLKQRVTTQDGATFSTAVTAFDQFARPATITQSSSVGYARTDSTAYHNDLSLWVVGLPKIVTNVDTGLVVSQVDYDASALPWKTYAFGKLQQAVTYNSDGTIATISDARDGVDGLDTTVTLSNWKRGIPQSIKHPPSPEAPAGATESAAVNDDGTIASVTDENGYVTSYGYDPMGRLASEAYPTGDSVAWAPRNAVFRPLTSADWIPAGFSVGQWIQHVTQGNYVKVTYFDALWRPLLVHEYDQTDIAGTLRASSTAYDALGRVAFQSYPSSSQAPPGVGTWNSYDALGRVTQVKQDSELGQLTTSTEYLSGFKTQVTNPRGYQRLSIYQAFGEPTYDFPTGTSEFGGDRHTEIYRDLFGRVTALRRRNGSASEDAWRYYVYNGSGELCKTVEPEAGATVMDYDAAGNVQWTASGLSLTSTTSCDTIAARDSGRKVTRYYDSRDRVTAINFPDGNGDQNFEYWPDGLLKKVTTFNDGGANSAVNAYDYNKRRLLTAESLTQPGWYWWPIAYGYDANGSLAAINYPTNLTVDYAPNALGQPTKAGPFASNVSYYPNGAVKQFTYGNGIVHTMLQNTRQLPARVTSAGVLDFDTRFDKNGNVTDIFDLARGSFYNRHMYYDGVDRMTDAGSWVFGGDAWHHFTYDALDNLKSWKLAGVKDYANYYYEPGTNRLTNIQATGGASIVGLGYDVQGNLRNKNGQNYSFDYGNRLREVTGKEYYRYDGHGRRILAWSPASGGILSQYSQAGQLLYQHDDRKAKTFEYVYLAGSLVGIRDQSLVNGTYTTNYQHTDALGSPVAVTNASGQVVERTDYEPYGATINKTIDGVGFTGHVMDAATGLTYMQQRYYDPSIGRFLSVDPVTADGATGANFNRYKYATNNPYRFTDPDGRMDKETRKELAGDRRSMNAHPSLRGSVTTIGGAASARSSGAQSSGRPLARSAGELARNVAGAVADATNMTLYGEVSGAAGIGGTLAYSDNLKTGEQKLELMGAIGEGAGAFAGVEVDILTFSIPGAKDAPVFFDSGDVKMGDVIAGGLKLQLNPGGTATLKGFGGLGVGGKAIVNKPLSIGTTLWSNKDD